MGCAARSTSDEPQAMKQALGQLKIASTPRFRLRHLPHNVQNQTPTGHFVCSFRRCPTKPPSPKASRRPTGASSESCAQSSVSRIESMPSLLVASLRHSQANGMPGNLDLDSHADSMGFRNLAQANLTHICEQFGRPKKIIQ